MLDVTYHCKPVPPAGSAARGAAAAMQAAGRAAMIAGKAAQVLNIAGDAVEAVEADAAGDAAMASALGMWRGVKLALRALGVTDDALAAACLTRALRVAHRRVGRARPSFALVA